MSPIRKILLMISTCAFLGAVASCAQDEPSLGDAARQARLQKQKKEAQAKDAAPKDGTAKDAATDEAQSKGVAKDTQITKMARVVTNDEIPEHVATKGLPASKATDPNNPPVDYEGQAPADYWKQQIEAQKNNIAAGQSQLSMLIESIRYAGGNCVSNCAQWNEQQQKKQAQADSMKSGLEQMQKQLEAMQDMARQQGYGSSVYDP